MITMIIIIIVMIMGIKEWTLHEAVPLVRCFHVGFWGKEKEGRGLY